MAELIVALDEPIFERSLAIVQLTSDDARWYKVGYEAFYSYGERILNALAAEEKSILLDLKLHDIPNTVAAAVHAISRFKPQMVTIHAAGGAAMLEAAVKAQAETGCDTKLLAVTLLTSMTGDDLRREGFTESAERIAVKRAELAINCGMDGVVCAVSEASAIRRAIGDRALIVSPGIRPVGAAAADQRRVATPAEAARAGVNFIVVGRPITEAADPATAARAIAGELAAAR
jgi:orotidine-5'-phosphate decarboxylase